MKLTDTFSKRLLTIAVALSLVLLSSSVLIWSINSAFASPHSNETIPTAQVENDDIGRYQMQLRVVPQSDYPFKYVLVWDTKTGKSKMFDRLQLDEGIPARPLP